MVVKIHGCRTLLQNTSKSPRISCKTPCLDPIRVIFQGVFFVFFITEKIY